MSLHFISKSRKYK